MIVTDVCIDIFCLGMTCIDMFIVKVTVSMVVSYDRNMFIVYATVL
jgi:hypothetical protein